jgi:hypothetical protein
LQEELLNQHREIQRVEAYYQIVQSGAFHYLVNFLADFAQEGLAKVREAMEKDPGDEKTIAALSGRWNEREELIDAVRKEVSTTLRSFKDWAASNLSDEEIEKYLIAGGINVRQVIDYEPPRELFPDWGGDAATEEPGGND